MHATYSAPEVIAHRGASAYAPEHTIAAYDLALEMGADVLEIDVRLTADGVPVVVHDRTLMRTAADPRAVGAVTAAELDRLDPAVRPLRLEDVLRTYGSSTRLLIDLKDPKRPLELRVADAITAARLTGRVQVQCFGRQGLVRTRRSNLSLSLAQLYPPAVPAKAIRWDLARAARLVDTIGPHSLSVDAGVVTAAHKHGLRVQPYTVNCPDEVERLVELGVDAVITDVPDVARGAIAAAGLVAA